MSTRQERLQERAKRKNYYGTLAQLRQAHRKLFFKNGSTSIVQRQFASIYGKTKLLLVEGCLRVLASDKHLRRKACQFYLDMESEFGEDVEGREFEVMVTANVILYKYDSLGKPSYSVYYGECFDSPKTVIDEDQYRGSNEISADDDDHEDRQHLTEICERFKAKNVIEFRQRFPKHIDLELISEKFAHAIDETSDVSIHSVINIVVLVFKLCSSHPLRQLPYATPRVEQL